MDRIKTKRTKLNSYKAACLTVVITLLSGFCACMGEKEASLKYISHEELMSYQQEVELTPENWEKYFVVEETTERYQDGEYDSYWYQPCYLKVREECIVISDMIELSLEGDMNIDITKHLYPWDNTVQGYIASDETETDQWENTWEWELSFTQTARKVPFFMFKEGYNSLTYIGDNPDALLSGNVPSEDYAQSETEYVTSVKELRACSVKGIISIFNIPEEVWNIEEEGVRYLLIGEEGNALRIYELTIQDDIKRYFAKRAEE